MLINYKETTGEGNVKFVSYTGRYPNLCSGVLTLLIDGREVRFGHDTYAYNFRSHKYDDDNYDEFWTSGGDCGFSGTGKEIVSQGEWRIDVEALPDELKKYAAEIDEVFNVNVPFGCCGGCL